MCCRKFSSSVMWHCFEWVIPDDWKDCSAFSCGKEMKVLLSFEMSGTGHRMTWLHSRDMKLQLLCCENLKSHIFLHCHTHDTHPLLFSFECSWRDAYFLMYIWSFIIVLLNCDMPVFFPADCGRACQSYITWWTAISLLLYITIAYGNIVSCS
jgi:hypothetical protein